MTELPKKVPGDVADDSFGENPISLRRSTPDGRFRIRSTRAVGRFFATATLLTLAFVAGCHRDPRTPERAFLDAGKYVITADKDRIPPHVLDSLKAWHQWDLGIGDSSDHVVLGCVRCVGVDNYDKLLKHALVGDTACIIMYTQGGFVSNDVVEFVQYGTEHRDQVISADTGNSDFLALRKVLANHR